MSDITPFLNILGSFGVNVAASAFWDFLKQSFSNKSQLDRATFERELTAFLQVHGANVKASTVIDMFAAQGLLSIKGSTLFAPNQITMGAGPESEFSFGYDSKSTTDRTEIETPGEAEIRGRNAAIVQNPDGSISFLVGQDKDE